MFREGKSQKFIMNELAFSKYGHEFKPTIQGIRDLSHYTKDMVCVILETYDEYLGRPHAGYNEEGYYQGGIPE
jgi:hypothetical protein